MKNENNNIQNGIRSKNNNENNGLVHFPFWCQKSEKENER